MTPEGNMLLAKDIFRLGFLVCLSTVFCVNIATAGDAKKSKSDDGSKKKCCMTEALKGCSDREKRTSQALDQLMSKVNDASKSDDAAKMKAALNDMKKALADMKSDHDKSGDVLKQLHDKMQNLRKQIKATKAEHDKAANLVDDEDMDDIIWAY